MENCAAKNKEKEGGAKQFFSKKKRKIDNKVSMCTDLKRNAIQR